MAKLTVSNFICTCNAAIIFSLLGETYLHRIGRTGRFGKHGLAINLVDGPKSMAVLKEIERHFGKDIVKLDAEVKSMLAVKYIVRLINQL